MSSRGFPTPAASSPCRLTSPGCPSPGSPADRESDSLLPFDSDAYIRLEALHSIGGSASGVAFATSTGDLLELSCHGGGIFRLRVGPDTMPEYEVVRSHAQSCVVQQPRP